MTDGYDLHVKSRKPSARATFKHHARVRVRRPVGVIMIDRITGEMTILGESPDRRFTIKFSRELTDMVRERLRDNTSG